jgi:hypothetical protein
MLFIGIVDVFGLVVCALLPGIFSITGMVFCSCPEFMFGVGVAGYGEEGELINFLRVIF